jgi:hypothetical protein
MTGKRTPVSCDSEFYVAEHSYACQLPMDHTGLHMHTDTDPALGTLPDINYAISWDHDPWETAKTIAAYVKATRTRSKDT